MAALLARAQAPSALSSFLIKSLAKPPSWSAARAMIFLVSTSVLGSMPTALLSVG